MDYTPRETLGEIEASKAEIVSRIAGYVSISSARDISPPDLQSEVNDLHFTEGAYTAISEVEGILDELGEVDVSDQVISGYILSELALRLSEPTSDQTEGRYNDYLRTFRDGYLDACNGVARYFTEILRGG